MPLCSPGRGLSSRCDPVTWGHSSARSSPKRHPPCHVPWSPEATRWVLLRVQGGEGLGLPGCEDPRGTSASSGLCSMPRPVPESARTRAVHNTHSFSNLVQPSVSGSHPSCDTGRHCHPTRQVRRVPRDKRLAQVPSRPPVPASAEPCPAADGERCDLGGRSQGCHAAGFEDGGKATSRGTWGPKAGKGRTRLLPGAPAGTSPARTGPAQGDSC